MVSMEIKDAHFYKSANFSTIFISILSQYISNLFQEVQKYDTSVN